MVELYAKFEQEACFYLKVKISSRDSSKMQSVWLAHIIGQGVPTRAFNNEWKVPIQGEILENGWVQFKLSIEDEISKTFGIDGWIFHELIGFRIRGSICISPITLYKIGGKIVEGQQGKCSRGKARAADLRCWRRLRRRPFGSMSRSAPPQAAPTRPLDTDVTCLHGPSAPQAACHGSTPHWA